MKSNLLGSLVLVALTSFSAFGIVRPGWERPIKKAQLEQIEGDGRYPRPSELTMNKQDGAPKATSFTLVDDTGIRCITTPCPSSKTTEFSVTQVTTLPHGSVKYVATSARRLIMGIIAPVPGHQTPVRTIEVLDHSNNNIARHKYQWVLSYTTLMGHFQYGGNPEGVMTIQGVNP